MVNIVLLMGRLTADPEIKTTPSGTLVTNFSIAVDRKYTKQGEERKTDFINIVAWNHTADFISKYFFKGKMIVIIGEIQTRSYEDKEGNKRRAFEVLAREVYFGETKSNRSDIPTPQFNSSNISDLISKAEDMGIDVDILNEEITTGDDLPF